MMSNELAKRVESKREKFFVATKEGEEGDTILDLVDFLKG